MATSCVRCMMTAVNIAQSCVAFNSSAYAPTSVHSVIAAAVDYSSSSSSAAGDHSTPMQSQTSDRSTVTSAATAHIEASTGQPKMNRITI
eukprot:21252-Heterococcus_DN1.PRE.2